MERKKINFNGRMVEVTPLTFRAAGENWNEYLAEDGSVARVKLVVTEILRVDGEYDPDGNPQYLVRSSNVVALSLIHI